MPLSWWSWHSRRATSWSGVSDKAEDEAEGEMEEVVEVEEVCGVVVVVVMIAGEASGSRTPAGLARANGDGVAAASTVDGVVHVAARCGACCCCCCCCCFGTF